MADAGNKPPSSRGVQIGLTCTAVGRRARNGRSRMRAAPRNNEGVAETGLFIVAESQEEESNNDQRLERFGETLRRFNSQR